MAVSVQVDEVATAAKSLKYLIVISHDIVFFFECCGDHRDLHSFPTRRSSDLSGHPHTPRYRIPDGYVAWRGVAGGSLLRSEAHTSELQSRRDLVCRLLLEKKKPASRQAALGATIARAQV